MKASFFFVVLTGLALSACPAKQCAPGGLDCSCRDGAACDDGLVCQTGNVCGAGVAATLAVSDAAARGCEVVLTEQVGTTVASVAFADGVVGTYAREAPRVAVSFVASSNAPLPANGVKLALAGASSGVVVGQVTCVDAQGERLPSATLSVR